MNEPAPDLDRELAMLPPVVERHLRTSLAFGPVASAVRLAMRGQLRLGRWLPFRATEELEPHRGFSWSARVANGLFSGSDRYGDRRGRMNWKLLGLVPVVRVDGEDVARSNAGRAGGESLWVPGSLLPRFGVTWEADGAEGRARFTVDGIPLGLDHKFDEEGHLVSSSFDRWGDPDRTGNWSWHRFGTEVSAHRTFRGTTIPSAGVAGWHHGTDRWEDGQFLRYEITDLRPIDGLGA